MRYILINLRFTKVYVFINGSFINNKNLSSQISFVLVIGTETEKSAKFIIISNIVYISFIKCKKVTRAVLVLKLYTIITSINILISVSIIINIIINKLSIPHFLIIIYTDSLFFYEYIIKLNITKKKRLIIDIIIIR